MRKLLTLALAAACVLAGLWVTPAATAGAPVVRVFFLQGEQLVAVDRPGSTIREAVTALIEGPTAEESERNVRSYVPSETVLRDVSFANGVARVDLGEAFGAGRDAGELSSRLAQLVSTVTSVPGVKRVRVLLKGGTPLGLFPGVDLTKPVRATDVERPVVPPPEPPDDETLPPPGPDTLELQQRLAELSFLPESGVDGLAGEQTRFAVVAFQKWAGLDRDGVAGPATLSALDAAERPRPRTQGGGRRIEVLLDRQLALLVEGRRVAADGLRLDGRAGHRDTSGQLLDLPQGGASWSVPFQVWLPWASYFVGGIAFHEYPDVPPYPASHGCVRVPRYDAQFLYSFAPLGTPVRVLATVVTGRSVAALRRSWLPSFSAAAARPARVPSRPRRPAPRPHRWHPRRKSRRPPPRARASRRRKRASRASRPRRRRRRRRAKRSSRPGRRRVTRSGPVPSSSA